MGSEISRVHEAAEIVWHDLTQFPKPDDNADPDAGKNAEAFAELVQYLDQGRGSMHIFENCW